MFHLQTVSPPILPRLCDLFALGPEAVEARPLHEGRPHPPLALQASAFCPLKSSSCGLLTDRLSHARPLWGAIASDTVQQCGDEMGVQIVVGLCLIMSLEQKGLHV